MRQRRQQHPFGGRSPVSAILAASLVLCYGFLLLQPALGQPGCPCDTPTSPPPPEIYPPPAVVYPPPAVVYPSPPPPPPKHSPPKEKYPPPPPTPPSQLPASGAGCCVIIPQGPLYVVDPSFHANGAAPAGRRIASSALRAGLVPVLGALGLLL